MNVQFYLWYQISIQQNEKTPILTKIITVAPSMNDQKRYRKLSFMVNLIFYAGNLYLMNSR